MKDYENLSDESEYVIDIFMIISNLWKGILSFGWIVVVLAIISSGSVCLKMKQDYKPFYMAYATFSVNLNLASDGSIYEDNLRASQMSATFPYIITSGVLRNIIAADLGVETVNESITAENVEGTNLFTLRVKANDAGWAYDVLQSVIDNYPKVAETVVGSTYLNMIEESGVPKTPSNILNYRRIILLGALPGAVLGFLIIVLYAFARRTIYKKDDFTELSNIKYLGTLPKVLVKKRGQNNRPGVLFLNEELHDYRENIYRIRTRVEKIASGRGIKSILVTSAVPSEGKSTVALNLALSMAEEGKKVILIDFDLYRPSIGRMLSLPEQYDGLGYVLNKDAELEKEIRYIDEMKIYVLACSGAIDNSSEIMGTEKIQHILEQLKENFDYVILDTAPAAILSDTSDLAKHVDGAIYVVRQDFAKTKHILNGLEHLSESSNVDIIGFVLNYAKAGIGSYGYGYGRYGTYGYGKKKQEEELVIED